jgi:hypothetical protein
LTGKSSKNVAATSKVLPLQSSIDGVLPEAANRMLLEVCGGGLVSLVLKTSNMQCLTLALLGSAGKDMDYAAVLLLDGDIRLKK